MRDVLTGSEDGPFNVDWVRNRADGLGRLATVTGAAPVVAMLVDLFLPDSSGLDTFTGLFGAAPQIPILILTTAQHEDVARLAVRQGAQDYFLKNHLDAHLLPKTLRTIIERAAGADALYEEQERARVTLNSIRDAVIGTDLTGRPVYLNAAARKMMGWTSDQSSCQSIDEVFRAIEGATREDVRIAVDMAISSDTTVGLTPNAASPCVAFPHAAMDAVIDGCVSPIHNRRGEVAGAVLVLPDMTTARAQSLRMSYLAQHDSLTDLPNRLLLNDRLCHALSLAHRRRKKMAVLFLDIDRFKHVNDSLGHEIGDRLLRSVARRLVRCVRRSDTVSRQGGDEFVIVLSEVTQPQDAAVSAQKMLNALSEPHRVDGRELRITGSIGIAVYPDDAKEPDVLLKHADVAMYHAKDQGRNSYQFFEPNLNLRVLERQIIESDLRRAVDGNQLLVHYQPKIDLQSGTVAGAEAFVRWLHPERGLIPPSQFMPIAEATGSIVPIGRWALREACQQASAWQTSGLGPMRIAVNVSAAQIRDRHFVSDVRRTLAGTGLAPSDLELELRETVLTQDTQFALEVLRALKELNVQLALIDFGTGYSSLSHLKQFPIDILKIDQSFVRELTTNSDANSIVSAVIGMGKNLGIQVVAEGVESREQFLCLRQMSCPQGQGAYFCEPLTPAQFTGRFFSDACTSPITG